MSYLSLLCVLIRDEIEPGEDKRDRRLCGPVYVVQTRRWNRRGNGPPPAWLGVGPACVWVAFVDVARQAGARNGKQGLSLFGAGWILTKPLCEITPMF